jgi:hypothetical protein
VVLNGGISYPTGRFSERDDNRQIRRPWCEQMNFYLFFLTEDI